MPLVVAFVSQKGGVGKSTLARGFATYAAGKDLKVKIADLDLQQKSIIVWGGTRARQQVKPILDVQAFDSAKEAVASGAKHDVVILDTAGKITDGVTEASQYAHLLVQPTSPSADDLHISLLVFLAMERIAVPREKLAFAMCRVLSEHEDKDARSYLSSFGYAVLEGSIPEDIGYRDAMRAGRSITETGQKVLDMRVVQVMADLMRKAETNRGRKGRPRRNA
jgi:chromosome partitioning protein